MAVIPAGSVIQLFRGTDLSVSREHQIYFTTLTEQEMYFASKNAGVFTNYTYIRDNGQVKLQVRADTIYDVDFMRWANPSYQNNKWFYAYVTKVEYVNNETSLISFELDAYQTWFSEATIPQCYVERNHVIDDTIGANTVPEPIDYGQLKILSEKTTNHPLGIMYYLLDTDAEAATGTVINNVYTPGQVLGGTASEAYETTVAIMVLGTSDQYKVPYVTMCPAELIQSSGSGGHHPISSLSSALVSMVKPSSLDGYTPLNNKCFTYPFLQFTIDNRCGAVNTYSPERFTGNIEVTEMMYPVPKPSLIAYPSGYNGATDATGDMNTYGEIPACPWIENSFQNWLAYDNKIAQNNMTSAAISTVTGSIAALASGNVPVAALGAIAGVNSLTTQAANQTVESRRQRADSTSLNGSISQTSGNVALGKVGFIYRFYGMSQPFARAVDSYFSRWGYAINAYTTPILSSRTVFTYIKTIGAKVIGNVPSTAKAEIASLLNNGCTFWNGSALTPKQGAKAVKIGDYDVDNSPIESEE